MNSSRPAIHSLTGLRGVAALLVVANHLTLLVLPLGSTIAKSALVKTGILGMTIFFVLSGFVMYYNYAHRISNSPLQGTVQFIIARVARLYPLLIAYVLVNFSVNITRSLAHGESAIASLYLTTLPLFLLGMQTWFYAVINGVNVTVSQVYGNPAWSVSAEILFYVIFIPAIALRRKHIPSVSRGVLVLLTSIAARGLFVLWSSNHGVQSFIGTRFGVSDGLGVYEWLVYYCPYGRCFEFFAGMGIAEIWVARRLAPPSPRMSGHLSGFLGYACLAVIAASFGSGVLFHPIPIFNNIGIHFVYTLTVPAAMYAMCKSGAGYRAMTTPSLLYIGEISYSLYFIHTDLVPLFAIKPDIVLADHLPLVAFRIAFFLALAIVGAGLVHRTLEIPAQSAILRTMKGLLATR